MPADERAQRELEAASVIAGEKRFASDPAADQSDAEIEAFLRALAPGDDVAIRSVLAGFLKFEIVKVDGAKPSVGRFYTQQHSYSWGGSAWYMKSGKNCFSPTGQARACIPTELVRAFAIAYPEGKSAMDDALQLIKERSRPPSTR